MKLPLTEGITDRCNPWVRPFMKKLFSFPWRVISLLLVGVALTFLLHFILNYRELHQVVSPPRDTPTQPSSPSTAPVKQPTSIHLALGNPSNADKNHFDNFLMEKKQFVLSYNSATRTPNWVSWQLNATWLGNFPRPKPDPFHPDTFPSDKFNKVTGKEYKGSAYQRGHMVPVADRKKNKEDAYSTFVMTNIFPQAPSVNTGYWSRLEDYSRSLVNQGNELYIISGIYGQKELIANGKIAVPSQMYKIIVVIPPGSGIDEINGSTRVIAVELPNANESNDADWKTFTTSVDEIEKHTRYDFLSSVSKPIQDVIESKVDTELSLQKQSEASKPSLTNPQNSVTTLPTPPSPIANLTPAPIPSSSITLPSGVTVNHKNPNYVMCREIEAAKGIKSDAIWLRQKGWLNPNATSDCVNLPLSSH